jgi:hypothetical protein
LVVIATAALTGLDRASPGFWAARKKSDTKTAVNATTATLRRAGLTAVKFIPCSLDLDVGTPSPKDRATIAPDLCESPPI